MSWRGIPASWLSGSPFDGLITSRTGESAPPAAVGGAVAFHGATASA